MPNFTSSNKKHKHKTSKTMENITYLSEQTSNEIAAAEIKLVAVNANLETVKFQIKQALRTSSKKAVLEVEKLEILLSKLNATKRELLIIINQ